MPEKISLALGGAKKAAGRTTTNGIKRPHASLHDDDEAHQDDGRSQTVSHFDKSAGGAIDTASREKDQGPLVIAPQANRDWKEASKRRRQHHVLPVSGKDANEAAIKEMEAVKPSFGLNVKERRSASEEPIGNENAHDEPDASKSTNGDLSTKKTDDELAMDALLGNRQKSELVLPAASEEEAFDRDYKSAPDVATLDDYARVPVEQFGAALLRGMGWKEGEGIGSQKGHKVQKTKVPERRPALLGIGAKEEAAVAQEMGAWGKAAKKGSEVKIYNPVLLRDKKTGELYTEEELQKKQEKEERRRYVEEFEKKERERERKNEDRRRYDDDDDDSRDHRRDKERRRERDEDDRDRRRRNDSRDRDRRRRDDGHDRDRRRRSDSDDEYYRRKEKDRRRRERDRHDSDYDSGRAR